MWSGSRPREALAWAKPTTAMTHIAIQEKLDGKVVDWMEHVSDEQYRAGLLLNPISLLSARYCSSLTCSIQSTTLPSSFS